MLQKNMSSSLSTLKWAYGAGTSRGCQPCITGTKEHRLNPLLGTFPDWKVWCMGGGVNWLKGRHWVVGHNTRDDGRWEEPLEVDWLAGMSLLVPTEVFRRGIWVDDRAFPQYSGDADFSLRARRAGYRLLVWPKSRIYNMVRNSGLTTKLLLRIEPFSWRLFLKSLTSIKSSAAFCTFGKLIVRHAPIWSIPLTLGRFYGFYFLKCLQVWLRLPAVRGRTSPGRICVASQRRPIGRSVEQEVVHDFD